MKAIIIDDERKARNVLRILVNENCQEITEIIEAKNLVEGVEFIKKEKPNIVFLDIEMPGHSGLEILDFFETDIIDFEIIFTTAYNEYAIEAFHLSAIDYLLKPIRPTQLTEAVKKAIQKIGKSQISLRIDELNKSLKSSNFTKIGLPFAEGITFVNFDDIILLKADGSYTKVFMLSEEFLVSKPLKYFIEIIKSNLFYQPHRSFFINLKFIKAYIKKDGGYILMDNGKSVSISNDKKKEFLDIIQSIG